MKWLTTTIVAALALATNSCVEGQDVINSVSDQEDAKGIRGQQQQIKSKVENEEVLVGSTPPLLLLPKKTLDEKPESIGVLSNDNESITSVDPQDQTVLSELSQPLDVEDRQAHLAQGRRLESDALQAFQARCNATTTSGETGTGAYVDCVKGKVRGTSTSCATACGGRGGKCCTGNNACDFFTGKVCRDGSCGSQFACRSATIPYVVGPSCTYAASCSNAKIGSADSSCKGLGACGGAQLSGVDLNNSCNALRASCSGANGNEAFDELIDCCNEEDRQCEDKKGLGIVATGCPAPTSMPSESIVPSQSSGPSTEPSGLPSISQEPSEVPSAVPSESSEPSQSSAPSDEPSEAPSEVPSLAPSNSPRVTSVTVVEPGGVSKTVDCCDDGGFRECSDLLSIAQVELPEECVAPSTSVQPSLVPSQSSEPSDEPSDSPSISVEPSQVPSAVPSESGKPSTVPSFVPSSSAAPTVEASANPSTVPTGSPSKVPTSGPSIGPTSAKAKTGEDYLKEALASSIFSRYPWVPKALKSSKGESVKKAKKNIKKALKTDNVFVQTGETLKASEVLGCDGSIGEYEAVCTLLSQSMTANVDSLN